MHSVSDESFMTSSIGNLPTNCLSAFDHFVKLAHKGLKTHFVLYVYKEIRSDIKICSKKTSHTPF